jgi:CheY-like chemotaxis protein
MTPDVAYSIATLGFDDQERLALRDLVRITEHQSPKFVIHARDSKDLPRIVIVNSDQPESIAKWQAFQRGNERKARFNAIFWGSKSPAAAKYVLGRPTPMLDFFAMLERIVTDEHGFRKAAEAQSSRALFVIAPRTVEGAAVQTDAAAPALASLPSAATAVVTAHSLPPAADAVLAPSHSLPLASAPAVAPSQPVLPASAATFAPSHALPSASAAAIAPSHLVPTASAVTFAPSHSLPSASAAAVAPSHLVPTASAVTFAPSHSLPSASAAAVALSHSAASPSAPTEFSSTTVLPATTAPASALVPASIAASVPTVAAAPAPASSQPAAPAHATAAPSDQPARSPAPLPQSEIAPQSNTASAPTAEDQSVIEVSDIIKRPNVDTDVAVVMEPAAPAVPAATALSAAAQTRILVIDDSLPVRIQMKAALQGFAKVVDFADSGEQAMILINGGKYDLIFLDVILPGKDGYEVCRYIRKHPLQKKTPVIMLTGNAAPADRVKGKLAGCDTYLIKPVRQGVLAEIIGEFIKAPAAA